MTIHWKSSIIHPTHSLRSLLPVDAVGRFTFMPGATVPIRYRSPAHTTAITPPGRPSPVQQRCCSRQAPRGVSRAILTPAASSLIQRARYLAPSPAGRGVNQRMKTIQYSIIQNSTIFSTCFNREGDSYC